MRFPLLIILFFTLQNGLAQKQDTLKKYLDGNLMLTSRSNKLYTALVYPENDRWTLNAYTKNSLVFTMHFSDKKLTEKDGPFAVYYTSGTRAIEGYYLHNQLTGVWQSWYMNGRLKDSGMVTNGAMMGTWRSWYDNGVLTAMGEYTADSSLEINNASAQTFRLPLLFLPQLTAIKHGLVQSWYSNALPKDSGSFIHNRKSGFWKSWHENGQLASAGSYTNNTLQGEWQFYREDGSISTREVYTGARLTGLQCFDEKGNFTGSACSIAKPPVFLGSMWDWKEFINRTLYWSKESLRNSEFGLVQFRMIIGKDGKLGNYTILRSPHELVTRDVVKVLDQMKDWSPAIKHNQPVEYMLELSLPFYPD